MKPIKTLRRLIRFGRSQDGSGTAWSLLLLASMAMLGGYAVDVSNVITARTNLQVVADASAHAALLKRERGTVKEATDAALALADKNLPAKIYGPILRAQDVVFGTWDNVAHKFVPNAASRSAVKVTAWQRKSLGNAVPVFLLQLVGMKSWDVVANAIYVTYQPTCLREGFVAQDVVDIRSNNSFSNGFCIHSNNYVSLNSNNTFEPGTVVSMPDLSELQLPNSGYKTNTGLKEALREGSWNIRIVDRIQGIISGLNAFDATYLPDYITNTVPVVLTGKTITKTDLVGGKLYRASCSGKGVTIDKDVIMKRVVLIADCEIKFSAGVALEDAIIATTSTAAKSINAPSGLRLGRNDNCAPDGGAQLLTMGSVDVASGLEMFGGQILAKNDISFAANANGIKGAAMVAGGKISGTSNMSMGYCGAGMEDNFHAAYFKLAE